MMPRPNPETMKKNCPQITQITLIFLFFFIIRVNQCNLWTLSFQQEKKTGG